MKEFLKNLWKLLIVLGGISVLIGSFILGKKSVECPPILPSNIQSVTLNEGENKALKKRITKDSIYILYISHQRDSIINILKHKNETKIIYLDTIVSADILEWARSKAGK